MVNVRKVFLLFLLFWEVVDGCGWGGGGSLGVFGGNVGGGSLGDDGGFVVL